MIKPNCYRRYRGRLSRQPGCFLKGALFRTGRGRGPAPGEEFLSFRSDSLRPRKVAAPAPPAEKAQPLPSVVGAGRGLFRRERQWAELGPPCGTPFSLRRREGPSEPPSSRQFGSCRVTRAALHLGSGRAPRTPTGEARLWQVAQMTGSCVYFGACAEGPSGVAFLKCTVFRCPRPLPNTILFTLK